MINRDFGSTDQSPLSRRDFLGRTGAVLTLASLGASSVLLNEAEAAGGSSARAGLAYVGSNIYGWGQYYQRENKPFDMNAVLAALHELGYDYLEGNLDVNDPDTNARFAAQMRENGLTPVTLYTGARLHEADKAREVVGKILAAAEVCRREGFRLLSVNADPIGREKTEEELSTQAAALQDLGKGLKALGMKFGVHHHTPEMANRAREFHYNFQHAEAKLVGFTFDVHWVYRGGVQPLDALKDYGQRVVSYHLRQSRNGIWWEDLDTGDIDYQAVADYIKAHNLARVFTVELALENSTKVTRSCIENHRRSREFVRRVFGA